MYSFPQVHNQRSISICSTPVQARYHTYTTNHEDQKVPNQSHFMHVASFVNLTSNTHHMGHGCMHEMNSSKPIPLHLQGT